MSQRGWLAPVYINDVMLMLAVDTGASKTMLAEDVFKRHFKDITLSPSQSTCCTADGDDLPVAGQFLADVQLGPEDNGCQRRWTRFVGDGLPPNSGRLDWREGGSTAHECGRPLGCVLKNQVWIFLGATPQKCSK